MASHKSTSSAVNSWRFGASAERLSFRWVDAICSLIGVIAIYLYEYEWVIASVEIRFLGLNFLLVVFAIAMSVYLRYWYAYPSA